MKMGIHPIISLIEIQETLPEHHYHYKKMIGKGGFGSVFLVSSDKYNQDFCIKRINYPASSFDETKNEATTLIRLCHPNIISMYEFFFDESRTNLYIVLEYCSGGSLKEMVEKEGPIKPPKLYSICSQIIKALLHCHEQNVSHRDIKPANILLDSYGRPKLADFGLSKKIEKGEHDNSFAGSLPYMAPEVISRQNIDPFLADIWSLGITFYAIAFGKLPWNVHDKIELEMEIKIGIFSFPSYAEPGFCKLIRAMTNVNPLKRESLAMLTREPIFENVPKYSYIGVSSSNKEMTMKNTMFSRSLVPSSLSHGRIVHSRLNDGSSSILKKPDLKQGKVLHKTFV